LKSEQQNIEYRMSMHLRRSGYGAHAKADIEGKSPWNRLRDSTRPPKHLAFPGIRMFFTQPCRAGLRAGRAAAEGGYSLFEIRLAAGTGQH
jgi:hypothetical protein